MFDRSVKILGYKRVLKDYVLRCCGLLAITSINIPMLAFMFPPSFFIYYTICWLLLIPLSFYIVCDTWNILKWNIFEYRVAIAFYKYGLLMESYSAEKLKVEAKKLEGFIKEDWKSYTGVSLVNDIVFNNSNDAMYFVLKYT